MSYSVRRYVVFILVLFLAGGSFSSDNDYWDLMLVLHPSFPITERLFFNPTLAIGGGDSDLICELQPQLEYKFTDYMVGRIGHRRLYYDIKGDRGEFDGVLHGVIGRPGLDVLN